MFDAESCEYFQNIFRENQVLIVLLCLSAITLVFIRRWFNGGWCTSTEKLNGKTVIITGANCGIGKETTKELAKRGAKVIMACKNTDSANLAAKKIRQETKGEILVKHLDLASFESIHKFAEDILKTEEYIHILINNADYVGPKKKTKDGFDMIVGTNYLGPFLLTHLLLDKMKKSAPARIINVSSVFHRIVRMTWEDFNFEKYYFSPKVYKQSKLSGLLFTQELAERLKGTGVTTCALQPGFGISDLCGQENDFIMILIRICFLFLLTSDLHAVQTIIYCAVDESVQDRSGKYFAGCKEVPASQGATNKTDAKRLWDMTMKMVGLEDSKK